MKLHHSAASPFARKVVVTAVECGFGQALTLLPTNPHQSAPELVAANPFSKVPAMEFDNGDVIFESLLICEHLDEMAGGGIVFPKDRAQRLPVLRKHAWGNGLMEVSVLRRVESLRGKDVDRDHNIARQETIVARVLDSLETAVDSLGDGLDLGNLSIAIALDYVDFRFPADDWGRAHPHLKAWHEKYSARSSLKDSRPQNQQ